MRRARALAALGSALLAVPAALLVTERPRDSAHSSARPSIALAPPPAGSAAALAGAAAPDSSRRAPLAERPPAPPRDPAAATATLELLLAELAHQLAQRPFDAQGWDTRARVAAHSIEAPQIAVLVGAVRDDASAGGVRIAAAELLRLRQELDARRHDPLPGAGLAYLRARWQALRDEPVAAAVAARSLAALGTPGDSALLLEDFRGAGDPRVRTSAGAALALSTDPWIVHELCAQAARGVPRVGAERALDVLSALARGPRWAFDAALCERVALTLSDVLEGALREHAGGAPAHRRALAALTAWDPRAARETLLRVVESARVDPALYADAARSLAALDEEACGRALRALTLAPPGDEDADQRALALASALAARGRGGALDERQAGDVRRVLSASASKSERPEARRRALHALGALGDPSAFAPLAARLESEPDPTVRAAGLAAWVRLGSPVGRDTVRALSERDPSEDVRRLAAHALGADPALSR